MWSTPKPNSYFTIKKYYILLWISVTTLPIVADLVTQCREGDVRFTGISENLVALNALYGVIYISACFMKKQDEIKILVENLTRFERFSSRSVMVRTDKLIGFYTKLFVCYGIVGNICYAAFPLICYHQCDKNRSVHMLKYGIPCGLVSRFVLPFRFDYFPLMQLVAVWEIAICSLSSTLVIVISMLICGVLIHTTEQLRSLRSAILNLSTVTGEANLMKKMRFCVVFHNAIIHYAMRAEVAFSRMMLLHITWTGFIISVLGFEITTTDDYMEVVRFGLHLSGWLVLLFIVCYYGQKLIDESWAVSDAVYTFKWYNMSATLQKYVILILARSQNPSTLRACGLKTMSLATFLGILYSAYSYFTLLLKLKPE